MSFPRFPNEAEHIFGAAQTTRSVLDSRKSSRDFTGETGAKGTRIEITARLSLNSVTRPGRRGRNDILLCSAVLVREIPRARDFNILPFDTLKTRRVHRLGISAGAIQFPEWRIWNERELDTPELRLPISFSTYMATLLYLAQPTLATLSLLLLPRKTDRSFRAFEPASP